MLFQLWQVLQTVTVNHNVFIGCLGSLHVHRGVVGLLQHVERVKADCLCPVGRLAPQQGADGCTWAWWWPVGSQCMDQRPQCGAVQNHPEDPPAERLCSCSPQLLLKCPTGKVCHLERAESPRKNSRQRWEKTNKQTLSSWAKNWVGSSRTYLIKACEAGVLSAVEQCCVDCNKYFQQLIWCYINPSYYEAALNISFI